MGFEQSGYCTLVGCPELESNECTVCMDGYMKDGNGGCKPFCGGFENCATYNDGCNNCMCNPDGPDGPVEGCTKKACLTQGTPHCNGCSDGYSWSVSTGQCELEGCNCIQIADPYCCDGVTYGNACMAGCDGVSTEDCQPGLCSKTGSKS